jgi:hypothetical protein
LGNLSRIAATITIFIYPVNIQPFTEKQKRKGKHVRTKQDTAIPPAKYSTASKSIFKAPLLNKIRDTNWSRTRGASIAARARRTDRNYRAKENTQAQFNKQLDEYLLKTCYKQNITWFIFTT